MGLAAVCQLFTVAAGEFRRGQTGYRPHLPQCRRLRKTTIIIKRDKYLNPIL